MSTYFTTAKHVLITVMVVAAVSSLACDPPPDRSPGVTPIPKGNVSVLPTPPAKSFITVTSNPPGARVEVGAKTINQVMTPGTGRHIGLTPIRNAELRASDVGMHQGFASVTCNLEKDGYIPASHVIGLGLNGAPEPGKTYSIQVNLRRIGEAP